MKKILWTTVFWLAAILIFRGYLKRFDNNTAQIVSKLIWIENACDENWDNIVTKELLEQIQSMQTQLDAISQSIKPNPDNQEISQQSYWPQTVKLFYFNQTEDNKFPTPQQINSASVLPIERTISWSKDIITDTINILLNGNLTTDERARWFTTEFPNEFFRLISSNLKPDGTLELTFSEVPWFTSWWSARVFILRSVIEKTAKQFPQVKAVKILPETLFQP